MVAVCGDFGEGPGVAYFHISFADDRMNDGETYMDEEAMWSVANGLCWLLGFLDTENTVHKYLLSQCIHVLLLFITS